MSPDELILFQLALRPTGFMELMRVTRLRRVDLHRHLNALAGDGRIWLSDGADGRKTWNFGSDPIDKGGVKRDFCVQHEEVAPGHVIVRFGDRWRAGHAQRTPATPRSANSLGNIYA